MLVYIQSILEHIIRGTKRDFFSISMIISVKIFKASNYKGFILLFIQLAYMSQSIYLLPQKYI